MLDKRPVLRLKEACLNAFYADMQDKRLVNRLHNYWDLIRRGKPMPEIAQFNPATIDDLWENCLKMDLSKVQGGVVYSYSYMGSRLVKMFGRDLTGTVIDRSIAQYPYGVLLKKLELAASSGEFMLDENRFVSDSGNVVRYRCCFLPFGNETKGVTHVIVGMSDNSVG